MYKGQPRPGAAVQSSFVPPRNQQFRPKPRPVEAPRDVAPALRVKNFKLLTNTAGDEGLAVALDMTMPRVRELAEGINFSNETAHHIESVLRLQSGFMDQVNPVLSAEDIARLKSPTSEPEALPVATVSPVVPSEVAPIPAALPDIPLAETPTVVDSPASLAQPAAAPALALAPAPAPATLVTTSISKKEASMPTSASDTPNALAAQREIRRLNLMTLTTGKGFKSRLSQLTGLSPANVSHRLHGNKIFDEDTAAFFCERLGLPTNWFETPKTSEDIPAQTLQALSASSESPVPSPSKSPSLGLSAAARGQEASTKAPALKKAAPTVTPKPVEKAVRLVTNAAAPSAGTPLVVASPSAVEPVESPVSAPSLAEDGAPPVSGSLAHAAMTDTGAAVYPIAEALVRTLAMKAKAGRLSEEKALQLLVEVASL